MHHRTQRVGVGDPFQQRGESVPITHVARGDGDLGVQPGQLVAEFGSSGRVHAPAGDQQQMPHTMLDHQMPRHQSTQPTRTAGDQRGPIGRPSRHGLLAGRLLTHRR